MRVLVCGSREWTDYLMIYHVLAGLTFRGEGAARADITIIHGAAMGADTLAGKCARILDYNVEVYPVSPTDWKQYGRGAGPRRNGIMLTEGKPDLVIAFTLGTPGTKDMLDQAKAANIHCEVHTPHA